MGKCSKMTTTNNNNDRPCFFKIITPDGPFTEHLRIPPEFIKDISKDVEDRAILRGPSGGSWHVKLVKSEKGMFMKDGWPEFLSDNSIVNTEFLLFSYDGNSRFTVQIFDSTGLERIDSSFHCTDQKVAPLDRKRRPKRARKHPSAVANSDLGKSTFCKLDQGVKGSPLEIKTAEIDGQVPIRILSQGMDVQPKKCKKKKDIPPKKILVEEARARETFTSKYPHFKACLKSYNITSGSFLKIPRYFAQLALPSAKTEMLLRNWKGKSWSVIFIPVHNYFSGGWRAFVRDNRLKQGDICIFELMSQNMMQVHVRPCSLVYGEVL